MMEPATIATVAGLAISAGLGAAGATGAIGPKTPNRALPTMPSANDSSVLEAGERRREARARALGLGQTRLTSGLGDTAPSNKPRLLGEVGS